MFDLSFSVVDVLHDSILDDLQRIESRVEDSFGDGDGVKTCPLQVEVRSLHISKLRIYAKTLTGILDTAVPDRLSIAAFKPRRDFIALAPHALTMHVNSTDDSSAIAPLLLTITSTHPMHLSIVSFRCHALHLSPVSLPWHHSRHNQTALPAHRVFSYHKPIAQPAFAYR